MCVSCLCSFLGLLMLPQKWDSFLSVSQAYSDTLERHWVFHQCWAGLGAQAVPPHLTALALTLFTFFTESQSCELRSTASVRNDVTAMQVV